MIDAVVDDVDRSCWKAEMSYLFNILGEGDGGQGAYSSRKSFGTKEQRSLLP